MNAILEWAWVTVWQKPAVLDFTCDAASGAIWIFLSLTLRAMLNAIGAMKYIPEGLLFSFPLLVMYLAHRHGLYFLDAHHPLLPIRIAESFLGRLPKNKIIVVAIANIIGCFFGVTLFFLCFSWTSPSPNLLLLPIRTSAFGNNDIYTYAPTATCDTTDAAVASAQQSITSLISGTSIDIGDCAADNLPGCGYYNNISRVGSGWLIYHVAVDMITSFFFCVTVLVLPEILHLNQKSVYFTCVPIAILLVAHSLLMSRDTLSAGMHPTAGATLWYLHMSPVMEAWSAVGALVPSVAAAAAGAATSTAAGAGAEAGAEAEAVVEPLLPHLLRLELVRWVGHMGKCVLLCIRTYILRSTLFAEQFVGVLLGGALAGVFCNRYTPDEQAWKHCKYKD